MRYGFEAGLAAGAFVAALMAVPAANADVTERVLPGLTVSDVNTCAKVFQAVNGIGGFFDDLLPARTTIAFTSFHTGDVFPSNDPTKHRIEITQTSRSEKLFDWVEHLPNPPPPVELRRGFDVAIVVTNKAVNAFIGVPATSQGSNYGDIDAPLGVVEFVIFCAKSVVIEPPPTVLTPPDGCLLSPATFTTVCQALQSDENLNPNLAQGDESPTISVATAVAGRAFESLCTCPQPGVSPADAQLQCNPNAICQGDSGGPFPQCTGMDTGMGNDAAEDECDVDTGECCAGSVSLSSPQSVDAAPGLGSCKTTISIGGVNYKIVDSRGPPCPTGWKAF